MRRAAAAATHWKVRWPPKSNRFRGALPTTESYSQKVYTDSEKAMLRLHLHILETRADSAAALPSRGRGQEEFNIWLASSKLSLTGSGGIWLMMPGMVVMPFRMFIMLSLSTKKSSLFSWTLWEAIFALI